jgi:hypothetical protein
MRRVLLLLTTAAALVLTGCSSDDASNADSASTDSPSPSASEPTPSESAAAEVSATVDPPGPYAGGETVTVSFSGFVPDEQVDITICANDGRPLSGPQDCALLGGTSNKLVTADATGSGAGEIVIINGPLGNTAPPALTCDANTPDACVIVATDLSGVKIAKIPLSYK